MEILFYIFLGFLAVSIISTAVMAYRYRQQIQSAWLMYKTYRQFKQKTKPQQPKNIDETSAKSDSPLARCPKCGNWTPQDDAVKIKNNYYCSHECMEASFKVSG